MAGEDIGEGKAAPFVGGAARRGKFLPRGVGIHRAPSFRASGAVP